MIERVQLNNVPKTHSKFYYEMTYKYGNAPEEFILLDVLYEDCLYDKTNLLDNATELSIVGNVFRRIGATELNYRNLGPDVNLIIKDIRNTSMCLSTYGKEGSGDYEKLVDGVTRIHSFTYLERYPLEAAIVDASKAAFLATMIEKGVYEYRKFDIAMEGLAEMRLADTVPVRLSKLRRNVPEAYYYWVLTSELLAK